MVDDVVVVTTGGTIAATGSTHLDGSELMRALGLARPVRTRAVCSLGSWEMDSANWLAIATAVAEELRAGTRVVITTGTATLEELAYFLLEVTGNADLVVTGATHPGWSTSTDGAANLLAALTVSTSTEGLGTVVAIGSKVYSALDCYKEDPHRMDGFAARHGEPVAVIAAGEVVPHAYRRVHVDVSGVPACLPLARVSTLALGTDPYLAHLDDFRADALVAQAPGLAMAPPTARRYLCAIATSKPVVLVARPPQGVGIDRVHYPDMWEDLEHAGVIIEPVLDLYKARIRMAFLLGHGLSRYLPVAV
ncbi:asparaginase domain-containing protein [Nocardia sp. NPDC050799]|uniref:asparaginase domain-containing protein n=1 Tax=Nocardia sp. NPDC050799 TaxID=3154842 RepID=UPI0033E9E6C8